MAGKLRHAAALALVGWCLLTPPVVSGGGTIYADRSVPLSKWEIQSAYNTKQDCEKVKAETIDAAKQDRSEKGQISLERFIILDASQPTIRASRKNSAPFSFAR
jgi:hypothetical protein